MPVTPRLIVAMTPPEDEATFIKRCIAIKANEEAPDTLPKSARESAAEFDERLAATKTTTLIFHAALMKRIQVEAALQYQLKTRQPIMPRVGEATVASRAMEAQLKCTRVIHPYDPKREDERYSSDA